MNGRPLAGGGQNLRAVRLLDFFRPLRHPLLPFIRHWRRLQEPIVNPSVVGFIQKKKALTTGIVKTFVVAEAGFEPTTFGL